ncbi:MAG: cation-transporting P-type ATPase, partial [Alphaproteobacteria bacterium]|nr:cation-transporting P-type ATPase [Alphaproteobacteria bacterium]
VGDRMNMLFAGTTVLSGRGEGVVVETGLNTEIGKIADSLLREVDTPPPLVKKLNKFIRKIGWFTVFIIFLIATAQFVQSIPVGEILVIAIALAVSALPEGLPVSVTIALTIATRRMQDVRVIAKTLPSIEGLGACNMIASDKTGTLTRNEISAARVLLAGSRSAIPVEKIQDLNIQEDTDFAELLKVAVNCNGASVEKTVDGNNYAGDEVDVALLKMAEDYFNGSTCQNADISLRLPKVAEIPYESERRYAAVFCHENQCVAGTVKLGEGNETCCYAFVKGASEAILPFCDLEDEATISSQVDQLCAEGFKVLTFASGKIPLNGDEISSRCERFELDTQRLRNLNFVGLVAFIDPVRQEVPNAILECKNAGIKVVMITGDHPATALTIAKQLNIAAQEKEVATGLAIAPLLEKPAQLDAYICDKAVFARIEPLHKQELVKSFQRLGNVVAVTGDGVNDAPALRAADIGVAMGKGGTDIARGAADIILTDDNFTSIVAGIREGRVAYDNIRKLVYLLITTGFAEIVMFCLAIVFSLPIPLFAVQLLWLNLVTNGIQDVALAFEKGEEDIQHRKPRPIDDRLFNRQMIYQVAIAGSYMGSCAFGLFFVLLEMGVAEETARNLLLLLMVLFENIHAMNARSETRSVFRIPLSNNWFLMLAILAAQILHISVMYLPGISEILRVEPVSFGQWAAILMIALSLMAVVEVQKYVSKKLRR